MTHLVGLINFNELIDSFVLFLNLVVTLKYVILNHGKVFPVNSQFDSIDDIAFE